MNVVVNNNDRTRTIVGSGNGGVYLTPTNYKQINKLTSTASTTTKMTANDWQFRHSPLYIDCHNDGGCCWC